MLQLFLQQPGRALRARDDVVRFGCKAHRTEVLGDFSRPSGGVIGDEQDARADYRECLDGAGSGFMAAEDGAVEIEK